MNELAARISRRNRPDTRSGRAGKRQELATSASNGRPRRQRWAVYTAPQALAAITALWVSLMVLPMANAAGLAELARIVPSNGLPNHGFGHAIAVDGNSMVVGTDPLGHGFGAAFVYTRDAQGNWIQQATLRPGDGAIGNGFGSTVAINGNVIVVGAMQDGTLGQNAGAAYVFRRNIASGAWIQTAKLFANDGGSFDLFGHALDIMYVSERSSYVIAVGAPLAYLYDANGLPVNRTGAVYTFESQDAISWSMYGRLTPGTSEDLRYNDNARFGWSLALAAGPGSNDDWLIVGAPQFGELQLDTGAVGVFRNTPEDEFDTSFRFYEYTYLLPSGFTHSRTFYGWSVAFDLPDDPASGYGVIAVGSPNFGNEAIPQEGGQAFIYAVDLPTSQNRICSIEGVALCEFGSAANPNFLGGDGFGRSVAISDAGTSLLEVRTLLVGAPQYAHNGLQYSGAVFEYLVSLVAFYNDWPPLTGIITPSTASEGDGFGEAVAMYGDSAVIGSPQDLSGLPGAAYVFKGNTASVLIEALITRVEEMNLKQGINNGLDAKLDAIQRALTSINSNDDAAAMVMLQAFRELVQTQSGQQLTESQARVLETYATSIIDTINAGQ